MKEKRQMMATLKIMGIMIMILLPFGVTVGQESNNYENVATVWFSTPEEEDILYNYNLTILERYTNGLLIDTDEDTLNKLESEGLRVDRIYKRTIIYVKGSEFDFMEGEPDMPDGLRVEGYEPGTKGLYIVHMLGPIAKDWRPTLEEMGVEVLNYMHNYAYRVWMTPELAEDVYDLYFVDWVGYYHPYYKLQPELKPGTIIIVTVPGVGEECIDIIEKLATVEYYSKNLDGGYSFKTIINSTDTLHEIASINEVLYLTKHYEISIILPGLSGIRIFEPIGNGTVNFENGVHYYEPGDQIELKATPGDGWSFDGWIFDGEFRYYEEHINITIDRMEDVLAVFAKRKYSLTILDNNGYIDIEPISTDQLYEHGDSVRLTATVTPEQNFTGWLINGEFYSDDIQTTIVIDQNMEIQPIYESIDQDIENQEVPEENENTLFFLFIIILSLILFMFVYKEKKDKMA